MSLNLQKNTLDGIFFSSVAKRDLPIYFFFLKLHCNYFQSSYLTEHCERPPLYTELWTNFWHFIMFLILTLKMFLLPSRHLLVQIQQSKHQNNMWNLGWLAHLVSRFACNTRLIVDASSSPPVSLMSNSCNKTLNQINKQINLNQYHIINQSKSNSTKW